MRTHMLAAACTAALCAPFVTPAVAAEPIPELPEPGVVKQAPEVQATAVAPGFTATVPAPLPLGEAWFSATSLPEWATLIEADGTVRLAPGEDVTPGAYEFPIVAHFNDETTKVFPVRVIVGEEGAPASAEGVVIDAFVKYAPEVSHRCSATALGVGLPLLVLLPLGFASQVSLPLVARQNDLNLQVENVGIDLRLKDLNSRDLDLGIAAGLTLAGIAGAAAIISQCVPSAAK